MKIENIDFKRRKYGRELLVDCSLFSFANIHLQKNLFQLNFYGIYIITQGNGTTRLNDTQLNFKERDLLFFQPGQVRQWLNVSKNFKGYFLVFENEFIETFFQDSLFLYKFYFFHNNAFSQLFTCSIDFHDSIIGYCKLINTELNMLAMDSHHLLRSVLYTVLILINREIISNQNLKLNDAKDNIALKFTQLVDERIREFNKLESYADLLGISRSHLNNISRNSLGVPASQIIKERLLTEIKSELLYTNNSIKAICYSLNFSDISNFIRFFKTRTGHTPSKFRHMNTI